MPVFPPAGSGARPLVKVRSTFIRAATAGFAGFAVLGLVTAVNPVFFWAPCYQISLFGLATATSGCPVTQEHDA